MHSAVHIPLCVRPQPLSHSHNLTYTHCTCRSLKHGVHYIDVDHKDIFSVLEALQDPKLQQRAQRIARTAQEFAYRCVFCVQGMCVCVWHVCVGGGEEVEITHSALHPQLSSLHTCMCNACEMQVCKCVCVCACMHACMHACMCACVRVCVKAVVGHVGLIASLL